MTREIQVIEFYMELFRYCISMRLKGLYIDDILDFQRFLPSSGCF